jgi:uncharacterized protein YecE (DUF72 family)
MGTADPTARRGRLRVGCSGWSYDEWVGPFYPEGIRTADRLAFYAEEFDSVEVNSTHYGTPSAATIDGWRSAVPADFRFAVKLHRFGTHRKKLMEPEQWVPRSAAPPELLGAQCGPLLVQLPPRWRPELARLDAALTVLSRTLPRRRRVVEIRDERWLGPALDELLARHRTALCHHDLLDVDGLSRPTASFVYVRFHGPDRARPYHGSYSSQRLRAVAQQLAALLDGGIDAYAYFNNDIGAAAPADARRLRAMVLEASSRAA